MPSLAAPAVPPGTLAGTKQPVIDGAGVRLRPWRPDDHEVVRAAYADPAVQRWHVRSMDALEAQAWVAAWSGRWKGESGAGWAVERDGAVAGQISLRRIDLHDGLAEVSYWVLPAARGAGLAGRALTALTAWSFGTLGLHRIEVAHSTANPASCAVAARAGFALEGTKRSEARHADGWHDMHLHARLATD
ncbi:GNAT family N-acetyltransferase [Asanoa sp. WMMD1127]|uniref:GNAT family N-acetyltransferase n=1 Tax=Asanoa sp. WMMD1127 TaxID=3016107 RepID=UPI002416F6D9|nr:GNAT family N-acetyltransferase [Asanoa sp. WMMD1127]MDG4825775.1 GNAT family N-acetyltransferase [Asanoa sp. WMMD1127]